MPKLETSTLVAEIINKMIDLASLDARIAFDTFKTLHNPLLKKPKFHRSNFDNKITLQKVVISLIEKVISESKKYQEDCIISLDIVARLLKYDLILKENLLDADKVTIKKLLLKVLTLDIFKKNLDPNLDARLSTLLTGISHIMPLFMDHELFYLFIQTINRYFNVPKADASS